MKQHIKIRPYRLCDKWYYKTQDRRFNNIWWKRGSVSVDLKNEEDFVHTG